MTDFEKLEELKTSPLAYLWSAIVWIQKIVCFSDSWIFILCTTINQCSSHLFSKTCFHKTIFSVAAWKKALGQLNLLSYKNSKMVAIGHEIIYGNCGKKCTLVVQQSQQCFKSFLCVCQSFWMFFGNVENNKVGFFCFFFPRIE